MSSDPFHQPLWERWESVGLPRPLFDALVRRYSEAHRHYHDLGHIADCFTQWQSYKAASTALAAIDSRALALAIFYHDAVYDPTRGDNEAASARLAARELADYLAPVELVAVENLILATAHFGSNDANNAGADATLIIDIDLSILGRDPASYDHYAKAIRLEYAHVDDAAYRHGRTTLLRRFLALPNLFSLAYFRKRFETAARSNLRRELATLEG